MNRLRSTFSIALNALGNRISLLLLELGELRTDLGKCAVLATGVTFAGAGSLIGVHLTLLAAVWDSPHRVGLLAGWTILEIMTTALLAYLLRRRLKEVTPFASTAEQIAKDVACVREIINERTDD